MSLILYSKDKCVYCYMLKEKLDEWGVPYEEKNITNDGKLSAMVRQHLSSTLPAMTYKGQDVLFGNTSGLTKDILYYRMDLIDDTEYPERPECDFQDDHKPV